MENSEDPSSKNYSFDYFIDDLLLIETSYLEQLKKVQSEIIIVPSLCRVYVVFAVAMIDFLLNQVNRGEGDFFERMKLCLPEIDPKIIDKYVKLRKIRHYICHAKRKDKDIIKSIGELKLKENLFYWKLNEFNKIKEIVEDISYPLAALYYTKK